MTPKGKSIADNTGEQQRDGSRRSRAVTLSALLVGITVALGVVADLSGVYGVVKQIWPRPIGRMSGDINVIYAPFTFDRTVSEELVKMVDESYVDELQRQLPQALDELTKGHIKYRVRVRALESIDLNPNSSSVERVERYQRIVRDHGAGIVVSGHLGDAGNSVILQSDLFVSEGHFEGAAELAGMHELDLPSTPIGPEEDPEGRRLIRAQFVDQIDSYVRFIAAISLYTYGDNHAAVSGLERVRDEWPQPSLRRSR